MKNLQRMSVLLLLLLCLSPFTVFAAEEGESEDHGTVVSEHQEFHIDVNGSEITTNFYASTYELDEVNDSQTLDFTAEVLNVTKDGSSVDLSTLSIEWSYFQIEGNENTTSGDHFDMKDINRANKTNVYWSISVSSNDDSTFDQILIDTVFELHVEEIHEGGSEATMGGLFLTMLFTFVVPGALVFLITKVYR